MERQNSNLMMMLSEETFLANAEFLWQKAKKHIKKQEMEKEEWITEKEALDLLKISKPTLYRYRNSDRFEYSQIDNKKILYNKYSILQFIKSNSNFVK